MMSITFQHITGAIIGGAVAGLFFIGSVNMTAKQDTALKAAQMVTQAIQSRAGINETINNMDAVRLCVELGGLHSDCEKLRGLTANQP